MPQGVVSILGLSPVLFCSHDREGIFSTAILLFCNQIAHQAAVLQESVARAADRGAKHMLKAGIPRKALVPRAPAVQEGECGSPPQQNGEYM